MCPVPPPTCIHTRRSQYTSDGDGYGYVCTRRVYIQVTNAKDVSQGLPPCLPHPESLDQPPCMYKRSTVNQPPDSVFCVRAPGERAVGGLFRG